MKKTRKIIEIDEDLCTGCGQCIVACAEGALTLVDGKARLVGEVLCDGLGACIGDCPEGALRIVERESEDFDQSVVDQRLKERGTPPDAFACPGGGDRPVFRCPSTQDMALAPTDAETGGDDVPSRLGHWPVKLQLLTPRAPFLQGADLVLLADCVACAHPNLHRDVLPGRVVAMGCPKFDDLDAHIAKLTSLLRDADIKSLTVVTMEVPCCFGFVFAAQKAVEASGKDMAVLRMKISRTGRVLEEEEVTA